MKGCDWAWGVVPGRERELARALRAQGFRFVVRYLSSDPTKNLTRAEVAAYRAEGMDIVTVWEDAADAVLGGAAAGRYAAVTAKAQLALLGAPAHAPVYFAMDFQVTPDQIAQADAYLDATAFVLTEELNGVYGSYTAVTQAKHVHYKWQTVAWSAGQWSPSDEIRQYAVSGVTDGAQWDLDEATVSDFGQWKWPAPPAREYDYVTRPGDTLRGIARRRGALPSTILRMTAEHDGTFQGPLVAYVNAGDWDAPLVAGTGLRLPAPNPFRKALAPVAAAITGTRSFTKAEPVMAAGGVLALLASILGWVMPHLGVHWTHAVNGGIITGITALAGLWAALRVTKPSVAAVTAALQALATAAAVFGLHLPALNVATITPVAALIVSLLLRGHVAPKPALPARPPDHPQMTST